MKTKIQIAMLSGLIAFSGALVPAYATGKSHMKTTVAHLSLLAIMNIAENTVQIAISVRLIHVR